jgi:membrane-bound serine protease (ClpP class)
VVLAALTILALMLATAGPVRAAEGSEKQEKKSKKTYLVRLQDMINSAYVEALIRKMKEAQKQGADLVILELDTPGGTVGASMKLGDFIFGEFEPRIVAYINAKAYSGGTMVALACDEIYIDEDVGAMGDVAPITGGGQEVGEKFQSPIRKTMVNYAQRNGYPEAIVEAMVTKEIEVYRIHLEGEPEEKFHYVRKAELEVWSEEKRAKIDDKELVVAEGELMTFTPSEAVRYGFAKKAVSSRLALYDELEIDPDSVQTLYLSAGEHVLAYLDTFSPLLIMGGLLLLFLEMNQPGFGLPGILGLACLATFFLVKVSMHHAEMLELILFVAGVALLAVEIFLIPGFGFVGGAGILLIFASLVLMLQQFRIPSTPSEFEAFQFNLLQVVAVFLATGVALLLLARYMGSLPFLKKLIRTEDMSSATLATPAQAAGGESQMIGRTGITITTLRPAGKAQIDGEPVEVVAEGAFIQKGTPVVVTAARARRLVVKPAKSA